MISNSSEHATSSSNKVENSSRKILGDSPTAGGRFTTITLTFVTFMKLASKYSNDRKECTHASISP
jgi:hypothetical protein